MARASYLRTRTFTRSMSHSLAASTLRYPSHLTFYALKEMISRPDLPVAQVSPVAFASGATA